MRKIAVQDTTLRDAQPCLWATSRSIEVRKPAHVPDVAERLSRDGADVIANTPEEFSVYLKAESVKWGRVVKEAGIHAD